MDAQFHSSVASIGSEIWNRLRHNDYPFLRYEFFDALEQSQCTSIKSGWQPHHLTLSDNGNVVAIMPLYLKHHSYGEYVFDWAWADAYQRHGYNYYPKLLNAIPFTPATGPRILFDNSVDVTQCLPKLIEVIKHECEDREVSSWHCLFPDKDFSEQLFPHNTLQRSGHQYHWLNQNYRNFDDFLDHFNSRKRKNLRKERQKVAEQGIELVLKAGKEISEQEWELFYQFYHLTYFKRSGRQGYLNQDFFRRISATMPEQIAMAVASYKNQMVAGALFFFDDTTLFGRYWGCSHEFEFLHFEACYYQGIEYAIANKLQRFDPGAQGEHKIQRGFTPIETHSNHWIAREDFRLAIERFLIEEKKYNNEYLQDARTLLPFKETGF